MSWQDKPLKAPASYPALQGKLVQTSRFTDGTIRTFFAPGQTEYSVLEYDNPTAWRPRGSLLKMPQVVWLSCHMPYSCFDQLEVSGWGSPYAVTEHTFNRDPLEPDASWLPYYQVFWNAEAGGFDRSWEGTLTYGPDLPSVEQFWSVQRYDGFPQGGQVSTIGLNGVATGWWLDDLPVYDARGEFNTAFQSVKASIESIRPGKTWVYINHWWFTQLPQFDTCLHLFAPPTDIPYVGTDFLHMYFGMVAYQGTNWSTPYDWPPGDPNYADPLHGHQWRITPFNYVAPEAGYVTAMKGPTYDTSVARIQAAQDRFARFRVMLFGHDVTLRGWELGPDAWIEHDFNDVSTMHTAFLEQQGTDLAEYGYSYEGMGTGISAAAIKNKIAAHFGFNPSTGADL